MAEKKQKNDIEKLSFESAIKELTGIVGRIEQGEIPLQQSLEQYERGMLLIQHCREILQKAEKRIDKITAGKNIENKTENKEQENNDT